MLMQASLNKKNALSSLIDGKLYVSFALFLLIIIYALKTNDTLLIFFLFSFLLLWDRRFVISVLLITPIIESVLIAGQGVTVTKLLVIICSFLFFVESFSFRRLYFDQNCFVLFFFLLITILGILNAYLTGEYLTTADIYSQDFIIEFTLTAFAKIAFTLLIYMYFKFKGIGFFYKNLFLGLYSISSALIIICVYFIEKGYSSGYWWGAAVRLSFEGADPNYFSGMLVALAVFPLSLCLTSSRKNLVLGLISIFFVGYSVLLTLSRGGFLSLCFTSIVTMLVFYKRNKGRAVFLSLLLIFSAGLGILGGLLDFTPIYERFAGKNINDISSLTAERSDLFKAGIVASIEKPIFGYGGTQFASQWISYLSLGKMKVLHNLYLEILIQYGLIGIFAFFSIIFSVLLNFIALIKINNINSNKVCFFIPFIALVSMLFSSLALSWQWKELIWYLIGLSLAVSHFFNNGNLKKYLRM